jgi:hypothetical protein
MGEVNVLAKKKQKSNAHEQTRPHEDQNHKNIMSGSIKPAAASALAWALAMLVATGATAATAASSAAGSPAAFFSRTSFNSAGSCHVVTFVLVL